MKRIERMYIRHRGVQYPLYQGVAGHPKTEELIDALGNGKAQILAEYYQFGMLGTDVTWSIVSYQERKFALMIEVKYSNE